MADPLTAIRSELRRRAEPERVPDLQRFFQTGPGGYGEGDVFIGVRVPGVREVVRAHRDASLDIALELLESPIHEERLVAVLLMVERYRRRPDERQVVYDAYLGRAERISGWDLVDVSAPHIVGAHLFERRRDRLYELAGSELLWERRIAILATFAFIRADDLDDTFAISEILLDDPHDLMHKATGWMLREAGKRDEPRLVAFVETHAPRMPRTMLRYAIERLDVDERKRLMAIR